MTNNNFLYLEAFPAGYGDCFMIRSSSNGVKTNILIDGGFTYTFNSQLKPYIETKMKGEDIELLVVTHIDADHIAGIIKFLEENKSQGFNININQIWHNSYRHLNFNRDPNLNITKSMENTNNEIKMEVMNQEQFKENENGGEFISGNQGSSLARLIYEGKYNWNDSSNGQAISMENITNPIILKDNIRIILLSPDKNKLSNLKEEWLKELQSYSLGDKIIDKNTEFDDALEFLLLKRKKTKNIQSGKFSAATNKSIKTLLKEFELSKEDDREANGSSIAFVMEVEILKEKKRMLFLGDSHPSLIIQSLEKYCHDLKNSNGIYNFDLIKISHHGSEGNSKDLLDYIDSDHYIISTNGKNYGHPDETTIAKIIGRPTEKIRNIYFNYATDASKKFNEDTEEVKAWKKTYKYEIFYEQKIKIIKPYV